MVSDECIHPNCECLDYCEAQDPHTKTPEPLLCRCGVNMATEPHSCPYVVEIDDNFEPEYCTCCDECTQECARDV